MIERCGHQPCGPDTRTDYCVIDAIDPDGAPRVVMDMLEGIVFGEKSYVGEYRHGTTDRQGHEMEVSLSYLEGGCRAGLWPLTETKAAIVHTLGRRNDYEAYAIELGWTVHQRGVTHNDFKSRYTIEKWGEHTIYATIEHHDVATGQMEERPMTPYDYVQLFECLSTIDNLHTVADKESDLGIRG